MNSKPDRNLAPDSKDQSITQHAMMLREALRVAENCKDIEWYGVGCVIADSQGTIVSTGYTGELLEDGKMRHAEDVAISKAVESRYCLTSNGITLYSTLEPCSVRASGKTPCCQHIIRCGIKNVIYGAKEPYNETLGIVCDGDHVLKSAGVEVLYLQEFEKICLSSVVSKRR